MKNITRIVCLLALLVGGSVSAGGRLIEDAYEFTELRIVMHTEDTGQIVVRKCDECPDITLDITPETQFFKADRKVPLADALKFRSRAGVAFRDMESTNVTRIKIY